MFLSEIHFSRRPFRCPPITDPAPQGPNLPVTEPARIHLPQIFENRFRLQTWLDGEQLPNLFPLIGERIRSRSPRVLQSRSADAGRAGISALSSGPCPSSLTLSLTTTSALPVARVALPAARSHHEAVSLPALRSPPCPHTSLSRHRACACSPRLPVRRPPPGDPHPSVSAPLPSALPYACSFAILSSLPIA